MTLDFTAQRRQMVAWLQQEGIRDERVLAALESVPREQFLPEEQRKFAYADRALPLHLGQTISQPFMVAAMTQALQLMGQERVLEIGTGSGYQTAILARLCAHVYSIERHQQLSFQAAQRLMQLDIHNISLFVADGSLGWPDAAPFDRILVTAAAPKVPSDLLAQLVVGGVLVIPVGDQHGQDLQRIQRLEVGTSVQSLGRCVFVPLVGAEGWQE